MRRAPLLRQTLSLLAAFCLATGHVVPLFSAQGNSQKRPAKPDPRRARQALERGRQAEVAGDEEAAFEAYGEAARFSPSNEEALRFREAMRFRLVSRHTDAAERAALAGQLDLARTELNAALRLDPSYSVARERLAQFSRMAQTPVRPEPQASGPPRLEPQAGTRDFDIRGDTRSAYMELARQFGLTAAFDPDLPPRPVRFRVSGVDFGTAAEVLAEQTSTFLRPVNRNTFFVAARTPDKLHEYAPQVERTFALPEAVGPEDMTELMRVIREISGVAHIELDTRSRTLTLRAAPRAVALAGELIEQIERARGELMLEIEILEVDRKEALQLGITPPSTARLFTISPSDITALQQAKDLAALIAILQRIFGGAGAFNGLTTSQLASLVGAGQVGAGALIPPLVAVGGGKSTLLLTLPGAAADFSKALNLVRSGRRILLRAQDGHPATFFVGERFPITLSLLSASLGSSQFIPSVTAGAFPRTDFTVGKTPEAIVTADFNGDSRPDLAVANHADNSVTVLLNDGAGSFKEAAGSPVALPPGQTGPVALAAADFNGDGLMDLAVVNETTNNVTLLLGKGDGTFTPAPASPLPVGKGPSAVVAGDFNGDNHLDLAVANFADNTVTVLLGDGAGGFRAAPGSPVVLGTGQEGPIALGAADFQGNGRLDLAVANRASGNVSILLGKGDGTFTAAPGSPVPAGRNPVALTVGDLDGDARPDLAVVNQSDNTVSALFNNGDATFRASPGSPLTAGTAPSGVAIGDFNVDGRTDLAVSDQASNSISVFLGLGAGLFAPKFDLPAASGPTAVLARDLNGDGRADLGFTEPSTNQVSIILNPSTFVPPNISAAVGQTPFPGSEYVDLGLKVRATPALHANSEVSLQLQFEIRALSGAAVNGIPILSNRTIEQTVRLRENETTLISGLIEKDELRSLTGLPFFAPIPAAGQIAGRRDTQPRETELLILVTPRQLRLPLRSVRAIYAGRGDASTGLGFTPSER